jgi:hypothetical protein
VAAVGRVATPRPTFDARPFEINGDNFVWHDAAIKALNGGNVSTLPDLSRYGRHATQGTGALQVPWSATGYGGVPCLSWSGSTRLSYATAGYDLNAYTLHFALTHNAGATTRAIWSNRNVTPTSGYTVTFLGIQATTLKVFLFQTQATDTTELSTNAVTANLRKLLTFTCSGTRRKLYINGSLEYQDLIDRGVIGTRPPGYAGHLGYDTNNNVFWKGDLAMVCGFARAFTGTEVTNFYNAAHAVFNFQ